jgi:hypothetical protein
VTVKWNLPSATDVAPGTCMLGTFQTDTPGTKVTCTAWEGSEASGSATASVVIKVDATPPGVAAAPDRPPDRGAWFNHPLGVSFVGTDATSGIASCDRGGYGGPDGPAATVTGTCRDVAGNVGTGALSLAYDATPPATPKAEATPADNAVALDWSVPPDAEAIEVVRLGAAPALVFRGRDREFTDRRLRNRERYRYTVAAVDGAGNRSQTIVSAVPTSSPLLTPARGAHLASPPLLQWKSVKKAAYYNVQLYRGNRKVLSIWPRVHELQLSPRWRFDGSRRLLLPGRYVWYVWPGFGDRSERRYGKRLGRSGFRIVAR